MSRKTAMDKKNDEIESLTICLNDADVSMAAVAKQRDEARAERDETQKKLDGMTSYATSQRLHIRRLFASVFTLNLELARKGGYIDRVKETDANRVDITEPEPGRIWPEQVDAAREDLAGARSERMVARVIDGMDTEVLDQVLGREPDAMDYDRG